MASAAAGAAVMEGRAPQDDLAQKLRREFIDIELNQYSTDFYAVRKSIVDALRLALPNFSGTVLDVGCGRSPYRPLLMDAPSNASVYKGMDFVNPQYTTRPDIAWDGRAIPLPDEAVDSALATEVLEHSSTPADLLKEIRRVLRPKGYLFLTVPFLWPLHDVPHDHFRYTPFTLERLLGEAGFSRFEVRALGGWDASLATMLGLWVQRRELGDPWRGIFRRIVLQVNKRLLAADRPPAEFNSSVMITGLTASAWK